MYACIYRPPAGEPPASPSSTLTEIAEQFSPRYERHGDDLVSIDVSGLAHLVGPAQTIGEELRRETAARGLRAHVAVAGTRMAALVAVLARPGLTIVPRGGEAAALEHIRVEILEHIDDGDIRTQSSQSSLSNQPHDHSAISAASAFKCAAIAAFKKWGLKTLGEVAALPAADLVSRLGRRALECQAIARGDDIRPLVPTLAEERFESSLELEWPIEELEPLSFVLTRLLEPLSTRLERRDRGAAVLHVLLRLVTREVYARRLELPTPMRDVRTLRTLALLDLESHPAPAAIDRVTLVVDPTPGRVLQHTLFTRAHPTPEQVSTLVARLGALMGHDRFGAAATVDSDRPGAFAMVPFAMEHRTSKKLSQTPEHSTFNRGERSGRREELSQTSEHHTRNHGGHIEDLSETSAVSAFSAVKRDPPSLLSALRRCRQPVPARVVLAEGRPVRVTTDRRGFAGGAVTHCAGPWRTSGDWWLRELDRSERSDGTDRLGGRGAAHPAHPSSWDRDEWDVSLGDGAVYRIFQDRERDGWFIDAIVD